MTGRVKKTSRKKVTKPRFLKTKTDPGQPVQRKVPRARYQNIYANLQSPATDIPSQAVSSLDQTSFVTPQTLRTKSHTAPLTEPVRIKRNLVPARPTHTHLSHAADYSTLTLAAFRSQYPEFAKHSDDALGPVLDKYNADMTKGQGFKLHSKFKPDTGGGFSLTKPQQVALASGKGIRLAPHQLRGEHMCHLTEAQHKRVHKARMNKEPMDLKFSHDQISHHGAVGSGWFSNAFKSVARFVKKHAVGAITNPLGKARELKNYLKEKISDGANSLIDKHVPGPLKGIAKSLKDKGLDIADVAIKAKTGVGIKRKRGGKIGNFKTSGLLLPGNNSSVYNK